MNLPTMFQIIMNEILWDLINIRKLASLIDDAIVRVEEEEGHHKVVEEVVKKLVENNLYIKPKKIQVKD